jgi:uncharacterized protein (DUF1499 family)
VPVDEVVLDLYPHMMRRLLEEADRLPGDSIVHVRFEELERDPLGHIERIYRSIKLDDHEFARPRIEAYLRSIQHYTKFTHTFSKESVRRVTQRWQPSRALRRMTEVFLPPLRELRPAPRRKGFRMAPRDWPGPADQAGPVFHLHTAELWRAWMDFAARQPRTVLRAQDERTLRSLHVQRSRVLGFPDLVRAEIVALGTARAGIVLDSRARFGCWDLGVNRRRVLRWVHDLTQAMAHDITNRR